MHYGRVATLLLGAWLGAQLVIFFVVTGNFRGVDRSLQQLASSAPPELQSIDQELLYRLLRFHSASLNEHYFWRWEQAQLGLVLLLGVLFFFHDLRRKYMLWMTGAIGLLVLIEHWLLTPEILRLGRTLPFIAHPEMAPEYDRFWNFHHAYSAVEIVKFGLLLTLTAWLVRRRHASVDEVNAINHAHDRHING